MLSIFEPHTDIIIKDTRETLFGHKLLLATGVRRIVQFWTVSKGSPADSTLVGMSLYSVSAAVGRIPRQAALGGGFASVANVKLAKAKGVKDVSGSELYRSDIIPRHVPTGAEEIARTCPVRLRRAGDGLWCRVRISTAFSSPSTCRPA